MYLRFSSLLNLALILLAALVLAGAVPLPPTVDTNDPERRRRGILCALFRPRAGVPVPVTSSQSEQVKYSHKDAIDWETKPVIKDGLLIASGKVKDPNKERLNIPDRSKDLNIATFSIKKRDADSTIAIIVRPLGPTETYTNSNSSTRRIIAIEWELTSTQFYFKTPARRITEPADLLVWGEDAEIYPPGEPLVIQPIEVLE